jgi:hypothetical protein
MKEEASPNNPILGGTEKFLLIITKRNITTKDFKRKTF